MSHFDVAWWLGQHVLLTAALAGIVHVACRVLPLRPATCHVLWVIVLLRLLIPPVATWPWSIPMSSLAEENSSPAMSPENRRIADGPVETTRKAEVEAGPAEVISVSDTVDNPISELLTTSLPISTDEETTVDPQPVLAAFSAVAESSVVRQSADSRVSWRWTIACLWLTGSVISVCVLGLRIRRVRRALKAEQTMEAWLQTDVAEWCERLEVDAPKCIVTDRFSSPFLWCPGRPRLVWPRSLAQPERRDQARPVLVHELAHLKRKDHWTAWLELLALIVWWWNPLFWFARRQLRTAAEMACDAWVVQLLPEQRRDYAESLLEFSQSKNKQITAAVGANSGSRHAFTRRLEMIMSEDTPARISKWAMSAAILLGLISLPAFSTEPPVNENAPPPNETASPVKEEPRTDPTNSAHPETSASIAAAEVVVRKAESDSDPTSAVNELAKKYSELVRQKRLAEARVVAAQARKKKPSGNDPFGADPNTAQPAAGNEDPFGGTTPRTNSPTLEEVLKKIESQYYGKIDRRELEQAAIEAILSKLDKQTRVLSRDEVKNLTRQIDGSFAGVGIALHIGKENKLPVVTRAILRSPAQQAGIRARDVLISIDGVSTEGLSLKELVEKIRGPRGSKIALGIKRGDEKMDVSVVRNSVSTSRVQPWSATEDGKENYWLDDSKTVGYVHIPAFTRKTASELQQMLVELTQDGATSLVLDLRDCPGGLLAASTEVADLFIDEGVIVSSRGRSESENRSFRAKAQTPFLNLRLAVLVNRNTASAAEIVAACLQDHHRAAIIGEQTFGRGTVQSLLTLSDGSALKLTTAAWLRPNGRTLQRREGKAEWGVRPDVGMKVELSDEDKKSGLAQQRQRRLTGETVNVDDDAQLKSAVAWLQSK